MNTFAVPPGDRLGQLPLRPAGVIRREARLAEERTAATWLPEVVALAGTWAGEEFQRPATGDGAPRAAP